jgi:hypothetical protein
MENLERYRQIIRDIIQEYAQYKPAVGEVETEVVLDDVNDHYELSRVGWVGTRRVHGAVIHLDIRNGKIWIQHDGTSDGVGYRLLEAGVPKEHIVLGFRSPEFRKNTEFAVS